MFIRIYPRRQLRTAALTLLCGGLAAAFIGYPQALATGVSRGLSICVGVIVPTLYPFMVLSGIITESPLCRRSGHISSAVMRWLFGLPGCCAPAVLLSMLGGYPAGAIALTRLRQQSLITAEELRRCARFCINAGPGFIISTVGSGLLGNTTAGILLYSAHVVASVLIGMISARGHRLSADRAAVTPTPPRAVADIVRDTCLSLLTMSGYVVLAAALLSLWDAMRIAPLLQEVLGIPAATVTAALSAVTEVSCGCIALAGRYDAAPFLLSMCLGWGGLSVQGQLTALIGEELRGSHWRLWRLLHGAISGVIATVLFRLFPAATVTSAGGSGIKTDLFSVSAIASVMLLLLSFMTMWLFSSKSTGNRDESMIH